MNDLPHSRRNPAPRKRRPSTLTIPDRVSPHVRLVFSEMQRQNVRYDDVVFGSGVQRAALKTWRRRSRPSLESIEAVLGYLGWDFVPLPRETAIPAEVVEVLKPAADRLGLSMGEAIHIAAEIAFRDHHLASIQARPQ